MIRVCYNPLSKNGKGAMKCKKYEATLSSEYKVYNVLDYEHLEPLLQNFDVKDDIVKYLEEEICSLNSSSDNF